MNGPILGLTALSAKHRKFAHDHQLMVSTTTARVARDVANAAGKPPAGGPKSRTGRLFKGTKWNIKVFPLKVIAKVYNRVPYAFYMEYGTRPHVISARRKRFLAFDWPKMDAYPYFAKSVNLPGTKPYLFLFGEVARGGVELRQRLNRNAKALASKF